MKRNENLLKKIEWQLFEGYQLIQGLRLLNDPSRLDIALDVTKARLARTTPDEAQKAFQQIPWTQQAISAVEERYHLAKWPTCQKMGRQLWGMSLVMAERI